MRWARNLADLNYGLRTYFQPLSNPQRDVPLKGYEALLEPSIAIRIVIFDGCARLRNKTTGADPEKYAVFAPALQCPLFRDVGYLPEPDTVAEAKPSANQL